MHKAAVAFGSFRIWSLSHIPVPFPPSAGDFTILAGDWFKLGHCVKIKSFAFISIFSFLLLLNLFSILITYPLMF
jgi:hypothetical protein